MTLDEVAAAAAKIAGGAVRPYSTFDFGWQKEPAARSLLVSNRKAERVLKAVREQLPPGFIAFLGNAQWHGKEKHIWKGELVLACGADQFESLRIAHTDAVNYSKSTEDLIVELKGYHGQIGIDIIWAQADAVEFLCLALPADLSKFSADIYQFCPDIVDQGTESIEALAEDIRKSRRVRLWWD